MEEKPKIYQNRSKLEFNNNKLVSKSSDNINIVSNKNIKNKIINILNSNDFIYRKKVIINIDGKILEKKIIGINNNNLITLDNEHIPIDKINDIYKK